MEQLERSQSVVGRMQLLLLAWLCSPSLGSKTLNIPDTSKVWCGCGDRVVTCYPRLDERDQQLQCPGQTCRRCFAMFANCWMEHVMY